MRHKINSLIFVMIVKKITITNYNTKKIILKLKKFIKFRTFISLNKCVIYLVFVNEDIIIMKN
ncbi:hypothetical protein GCM10008906_35030 [Clostridium oceanicum]|uniref:Uncharacterized protein n=1 Tax=Clostridium oceanicum TaxID=1543 RepID=A0ABP3V4E2_9CLOT